MFNKFKNELANLIISGVNANNDEVMLLTSEVDKLGQELNNLTQSHDLRANVILEYTERILDLEKENEEVKESNKGTSKIIDRLRKENEDLLFKQHTPAKHKQEISMHKFTIKNLEKELLESERVARNNKNYRETYEYISNDTNKQSVKGIFSHNLSLWMSENDLNDVSASKLTKCHKETLRRLKTGSRGVTINTLQYFDEVLCDYFECSVYELVSVKLEGKK